MGEEPLLPVVGVALLPAGVAPAVTVEVIVTVGTQAVQAGQVEPLGRVTAMGLGEEPPSEPDPDPDPDPGPEDAEPGMEVGEEEEPVPAPVPVVTPPLVLFPAGYGGTADGRITGPVALDVGAVTCPSPPTLALALGVAPLLSQGVMTK